MDAPPRAHSRRPPYPFTRIRDMDAALMRILLVDDEPAVARALGRQLGAEADLAVVTVPSGAEALAALARERFDAVITDVMMAEMNGYELLAEVRRRYPTVIRVMLSGSPSEPEALGLAHQYWSKPWPAALLVGAMRRAAGVLALVADPRWRAEVADVDRLPAAPAVVLRLNRVLADPRAGASEVADVIESDPAIAAKVLQFASSAFFSPAAPVASIETAVVRLGTDIVRALATSSALFATVEAPAALDVAALQATSLLTAQVAGQLVDSVGASQAAFGAGLLRCTGQLVLAARMPDVYAELVRDAKEHDLPLADRELERLGVTDAQLGAYLLGAWGLPGAIVDAVAHQDDEIRRPVGRVGVADAVRVAALLVRNASDPSFVAQAADLGWLRQLVDDPRLGEWRALFERLLSGAGAVRRRLRLAVSWPARLRTDSRTVEAVAFDVTERGVFAASLEMLKTGQPVEVDLTLPGGVTVTLTARVRWSGQSVSHGVPGMGLELDAESPALRRAIATLVHQDEEP